MSYESNWGFTDPTDEFGVPIHLNDYGSGGNTDEAYEFIVKMDVSPQIKLISELEDTAEIFSLLHISSDFEPISTMLVICAAFNRI